MNEPFQYLTETSPENAGLDPRRWERVLNYAETLVESEKVPAISLQVQRNGQTTGVHTFGHRDLAGTHPVDRDTRYLIASLTKPMVAMAVLLLIERGLVTLNQRVCEIVPEFRGPQKRNITVKNLLTHTSGLPDMLPNNRELRARNASLAEFVAGTAACELVFPTGTNAQYQSMGFALLGPVIENLTGTPYQQFMRKEVFEPLGMRNTWLGLPESELNNPNIAEIRVPDDQVGEDHWNWNSRYWKTFGAPWGGVISTVEDVSRFSACMLNHGRLENGEQLFHRATVADATRNRLGDFANLPESVWAGRGWGYGWRRNWPDHRGSFGDFLPNIDVCGHWGATGCLFWINDSYTNQGGVVIFSTQPIGRAVSVLVNLSNLIFMSFPDRVE